MAGIRAATADNAVQIPKRKQVAANPEMTPGTLIKQAKAKLAANRKAIKRLRKELRALEAETEQLARLVDAAQPTPRRQARNRAPVITN